MSVRDPKLLGAVCMSFDAKFVHQGEDISMGLNDNKPAHWSTFVRLAKQNMPVLPHMAQTASEETRRDVGRALNVVTTLLSGAGVSLPSQLDHIANVGLADSAAGFAESTVQTLALGRLGAAGGIVGGGVETLRGANQQLQRGHETLEYVLGVSGYVTTLAGMCLTAMTVQRHDTPYPSPPIPADMMASGDLFSAGRRAKFMAGVDRAWRVVTELDNIRPEDPNADRYSKICLTHIAIATGNTSVPSGHSLQMRKACEGIIAAQILNNDLRAQRERLRQWARS